VGEKVVLSSSADLEKENGNYFYKTAWLHLLNPLDRTRKKILSFSLPIPDKK